MERSKDSEADSIYWHNQTWFCASLSAGGAIEATRAVVAGQVRNAVAVIRPPGHHAEHDKESGFCFFNNVPIAVKVAQEDFPDLCRKILILDWDVHHGNGTQKAFYDDPNVLYIPFMFIKTVLSIPTALMETTCIVERALVLAETSTSHGLTRA